MNSPIGRRVRGPGGVELGVDVIVDFGFTASLTLPMAVVTALALTRQSGGTAVLGRFVSSTSLPRR